MVGSYAPDVQAEIDKQLVEAQVTELRQSQGGISFPDKLGDSALEGGDAAGSMVQASDPASRDKVTIYSTESGLPSSVLVNMLAKKLTQKLPDGRKAWSITPTKEYFVGSMKCLLHLEHPRRGEWDAIGLGGKECPKANIPSDFELRQHMLHRHRQEWAVMEEAKAAAEREEERAFRRMQMEAWQAMQPRRGRPPKDDGLEL